MLGVSGTIVQPRSIAIGSTKPVVVVGVVAHQVHATRHAEGRARDELVETGHVARRLRASRLTLDDGRELVFALSMSGGTFAQVYDGLVQAASVAGVAAAFQQGL